MVHFMLCIFYHQKKKKPWIFGVSGKVGKSGKVVMLLRVPTHVSGPSDTQVFGSPDQLSRRPSSFWVIPLLRPLPEAQEVSRRESGLWGRGGQLGLDLRLLVRL